VEDVGCFWGVGFSELYGFFICGVGVVVWGCSFGDLVVSFGVGCAEELFVISDEDVPDADCVFDGGVFLVVESSVEYAYFVGVELEVFADD